MYAYIKGTLEETGEDYIVVEAGSDTISAYRVRCLTACRPLAVPYGFIHIYMSKKMR